jgi:hypothetical protein
LIDNPSRFSVHRSKAGLSLELLWLLERELFRTPIFSVCNPRSRSFHIAMLANDDVKQDHAGIFTVDPIGRIDEWRAAMLAVHPIQQNLARTMPSRFGEQFLSVSESIVSLNEPMSWLCSDQDVYENMCRYWAYRDRRKFLNEGA